MKRLQWLVFFSLLALIVSAGTVSAQDVRRDDARPEMIQGLASTLVRDYVSA